MGKGVIQVCDLTVLFVIFVVLHERVGDCLKPSELIVQQSECALFNVNIMVMINSICALGRLPVRSIDLYLPLRLTVCLIDVFGCLLCLVECWSVGLSISVW